jgi:hypothetical protein
VRCRLSARKPVVPLFVIVTALGSLVLVFRPILAAAATSPPTFYRDVLPILQTRCQTCHRSGEIGPMPLMTYAEVRPFAAAIHEQTSLRKMPPWFAEPGCGQFANDPSLTKTEIQTLASWASSGARAGNPADAPPPVQWPAGWNIQTPDVVLKMPEPVKIPAEGDIAYTYVILPTHRDGDEWVQMSEIRPSNRAFVHHAVAYIREPGSNWLRNAPIGVPFTADDLTDAAAKRDATWTTSDILLVYAPGSSPDRWPEGYAKYLPAGSDIVLQMHYTARGKPGTDQTAVGLKFLRSPIQKRVLTLQLTNDRFLIPPGDPDHHVESWGTLPNDATMLSFFPHMHLRGKSFEYDLTTPDGKKQTLLRVPHYDFFWQLSYKLAEPLAVKAGSKLQAIATFDNSRGNPHNPDPDSSVSWGEQTWAEMMVGFFDVAVDPKIDKQQFFRR